MNLASDDDLQDYINQLSKKAQEFKYEDISSDGISPPSAVSSVNQNYKNTSKVTTQVNRTTSDPKNNKLKLLEEKYLNRGRKSLPSSRKQSLEQSASAEAELLSNYSTDSELNISSDVCDDQEKAYPEIILRNNRESGSAKHVETSKSSTAYTDEIFNLKNIISVHDLVNSCEADKTDVTNELKVTKRTNEFEVKQITSESKVKEVQNNFLEQRENEVFSEDHNSNNGNEIHHPNDSVTEGESGGMFDASTKPELERQSSTSSVLMKREGIFYSSSTSADKPVRKNSIPVFKDEVVWTLESNKNSSSSTSSKAIQSESIEEEIPASKPKSKNKKESHIAPVGKPVDAYNSKDRSQIKECREKKSVVTQTDNNNKSGATEANSVAVKNKKNYRNKNYSKHKSKLKEKPVTKENYKDSDKPIQLKVSDKSSQVPPFSASSVSSTCSSSTVSLSSLSSSTSISFKIRRKKLTKHKKKKHKSKNEKMLVKLITKTMIKVLPKLHQTLYQNPFYPYPPPHPSLCASHYRPAELAGSFSAPPNINVITQTHIEDTLRQTVNLTQQFLDSHRTLYEAYLSILTTSDKYSSLNEMEQIIRGGPQSVSANEAYKWMQELKKKKKPQES